MQTQELTPAQRGGKIDTVNIHAAGVWAEFIGKCLAAGAVVVGTLMSYSKYLAGRVYVLRMEPVVTGEVVPVADGHWIKLSAELRNVGTRTGWLNKLGNGVIVFGLKGPAHEGEHTIGDWEQLTVARMFARHETIESGEVLRDETLVMLPTTFKAYRLTLHVVCDNKTFLSNIRLRGRQPYKDEKEWNTAVVVFPPDTDDNSPK
jgi:hypothetical protein